MLHQPKTLRSPFTRAVGVFAIALGLGFVMPTGVMADDEPAARLTAATEALPAAETLLREAIKAQGGEEAFKAIKSVRTKGNMRIPMGSIDIETNFTSDGKFLIKQSNPMMGEIRIGYDGTTGWVNQPQVGYRLLEPDDIAEISSTAMTHDMVRRMMDEFRDMETVEKTSFVDAPCYKIRMVHKKDDREQFAFINAQTKRIAGVEISMEETDFGPMSMTIHFDEWKQRGDVEVFTKTTINQMGMEMVMELTEIEFNDVDEAVFELPEAVRKLVAGQKEREAAKAAESTERAESTEGSEGTEGSEATEATPGDG